MSGWSGPRTRRVGEQVAELGGGLGGLPGLAQPVGEVAAGGEGVGVVGSQHPQVVVEQVAELGGGLVGLPGLAQPAARLRAGGEGVGVVGSQLGLGDGQGAIQDRA